jgi:hypothetical protein
MVNRRRWTRAYSYYLYCRWPPESPRVTLVLQKVAVTMLGPGMHSRRLDQTVAPYRGELLESLMLRVEKAVGG